MGCSGSKAPAVPAAAAPSVKKDPEGDFKVLIEGASENDKLGLAIVGMSDNTYKVTDVREAGLVPDWNKNNESTPANVVKAGDLIVSINGKFGDLEAMKAELKTTSLCLAIQRGAAAPAVAPAAPAAAPAQAPSMAEPAAEPTTELTEPAAEPAAATEPPAPTPVEAAAPAEAVTTAESAALDGVAAEPACGTPAPAPAPTLPAPVSSRWNDDEGAQVVAPADQELAVDIGDERFCRMSWC
eukprot:TRINITY_DN24315_c0_g1_i1.p1 TRINITY_DN24315_c0_g1~~TRINITY_DN24315_c0_g1_i1.p1  ORF type:complete len:241 (-),score=62.61 TRINITY_DN24315_c0_g1_i1:212-934(-)